MFSLAHCAKARSFVFDLRVHHVLLIGSDTAEVVPYSWEPHTCRFFFAFELNFSAFYLEVP